MSCEPLRLPRPTLRRLASSLLASVALLLCAAKGYASDADHDVRHTVLARQALQADPVLAPLKLGVRVRNRVAVLWGPVPSTELGRRAVAVLKRLPDLAEVRSELRAEDDSAPEPPVLAPTPPAPQNVPQSPGLLAKRTPTPPEQGPLAWVPENPPAPSMPLPPPPPKTSTGKSGETQVEGGPSPKPGSSVAGLGEVMPHSSESLQKQIDRLRTADERYRRLRIDVQGGVVSLGGIVYRWEDVHELARALARLPGVERVLITGIHTEPRRR